MSNMNVKWMWKEHEGMQNVPEIGQQNASQQPTTLMQPTHILACHSAYLQVISSIDTSKKDPSMMTTFLMPMPYAGVLWWNPLCIQTLVHQLLSCSHATAHKYIWQAPTSHTKTTLHVCSACPLHIFSTPWTLRNVHTWQQAPTSHTKATLLIGKAWFWTLWSYMGAYICKLVSLYL